MLWTAGKAADAHLDRQFWTALHEERSEFQSLKVLTETFETIRIDLGIIKPIIDFNLFESNEFQEKFERTSR